MADFRNQILLHDGCRVARQRSVDYVGQGADRFVTGLKPGIDLRYGDLDMAHAQADNACTQKLSAKK
jgi:hypothetical protein